MIKQLTSQVQRSKGWNRHVNPEEKKEEMDSVRRGVSSQTLKHLLVTAI